MRSPELPLGQGLPTAPLAGRSPCAELREAEGTMDVDTRRRLRFFAALALYCGWILALGVLGVVSGRTPPASGPPPAAGVDLDDINDRGAGR